MLPGIRKKRNRTRRRRAKRPVAGLPRTRLKFEEARYFWQSLEIETRRMTQADPHELKVVGFLLSAFLGAVASVTNVLHAENPQLSDRVCQDIENTLTPQELKLLDWLDELRVDEVHVTGAEVKRNTGTIPATMAVRSHTRSLTWEHVVPAFPYDAPAVPEIGVLVPQIKSSSGTMVDVIPACQRCLEILETLVAKAERDDAATPAPAPRGTARSSPG
jgi:hypothetical protein